MCIKAVMARLNPVRIKTSVKPAKSIEKTAAEQILERKRQNLMEYLSIPRVNDENNIPKFDEEKLVSQPVNELIKEMSDDLNQIEAMFGSYGLAKYGEVEPSSVLEGCINIREFGYISNKPVINSLHNYLLLNDTGAESDIKKRFGRSGEILLNDCKKSGLVSSYNEAYHVPEERKHYLALVATEEKGSQPVFYNIDEALRYYRYQ